MDTHISHLDAIEIGEVFTPLYWAEWLIDRWGVYDAWLNGATVCDPTAGNGAFALALLRLARSRNMEIDQKLLSRIMLIELHAKHLSDFKHQVYQDFGLDFPDSQLLACDIITNTPHNRFDILIGNPPWANFTDLPHWYKDELKPHFIAEGLVPDRRMVLLGSSRTDIAALVLKIALGKLLNQNGFGCFYVPLSLFSGDDAHRGFRKYTANNRCFAVNDICEFTNTKIFSGIGTAYCCARFDMDTPQKFPVRYFREAANGWREHRAIPFQQNSDPWRILARDEADTLEPIEVRIAAKQKPRQGVNTCGANSLFIFEKKPGFLPDEFLFPLATKEQWKPGHTIPSRWILLPYDRDTASPLAPNQIDQIDALRNYFGKVQLALKARKGILIRSAIDKGLWWSLLGVGPYSFAPYKVMWEAYGMNQFTPIILHEEKSQPWQGNQAMHAFIPCWSEADAKRIHTELQSPAIPALLKQLNGDGKCNWAQPGKMIKVLAFDHPQLHQPLLFN